MATKPIDQWTPDELRLEIARLTEELAKRAGVVPPTGKKAPVDVAKACENWVRGHAWDDTFTLEMVEDEFSVHERGVRQELQPLERERLLQLWRAIYGERYPEAA